MKKMSLIAGLFILLTAVSLRVAAQQTRDEKVREDRRLLAEDQSWYYDDLQAGIAEAAKLNKPLMVVLRCIP